MKFRLTSLDIRAIVNELNERLVNKYIQNFYSKQQRFTYIKFSSKDVHLIEPGYTLFLTDFHDSEISHFCKKLRERCRHSKVSRIYQSGFDRIIVIDIKRYKLVIEMFSNGNIFILDEEDNIVDLQRPVEALGMTKNSKYVWNSINLDLSYDGFINKKMSDMLFFEKDFVSYVENEMGEKIGRFDNLKEIKYKEKVEKYFCELRDRIECIGGFGEVCVNKGKLECFFTFPTQKKNILEVSSDILVNKLSNYHIGKINDKDYINKDYTDKDYITKDYINKDYKIKYWTKEEVNEFLKENKKYKAFHFKMFNEAVAFCFSERKKTEKVKLEKNERIINAQQAYIKQLENLTMIHQETAEVLENNRAFVNQILKIFKIVYEQKMKWDVFEKFWESEKERENLYSLAILSFDLKLRKAVIKIDEHLIEMDLGLSLDGNIDKYYGKRKKALEKGKKTIAAMSSLSKIQEKKKVLVKPQSRIPYWFEKFNYFFTSENVLVIGGKNAQENEIVVKNYLEKDDLYFHCDVQGASSVVCKGKGERTIEEASYMALCYSKCWEEGVIKPVFYVNAEQVSKTPQTGEFLVKGSFIIIGKKNIMNPYKIEYGLGLLFKEEGSKPLEFKIIPTTSIVHAMPTCGPWNLIKNYKYHVRLCPGNEKKSQIAKKIISLFTQQSENSFEERFVKAISIDEYIKIILNKAKIGK